MHSYVLTLAFFSSVFGILFLYQISSPLSSPYSAAGTNVNFTLPYFFFELATNITVTILIVLRLYLYRLHMKHALLGPGHVAEHTSVESVIVESAAIYSTFSLLFLIPFATKSPVANVFMQVLGEAQVSIIMLIQAFALTFCSSLPPFWSYSVKPRGTAGLAPRYLQHLPVKPLSNHHNTPASNSRLSICITKGSNLPTIETSPWLQGKILILTMMITWQKFRERSRITYNLPQGPWSCISLITLCICVASNQTAQI